MHKNLNQQKTLNPVRSLKYLDIYSNFLEKQKNHSIDSMNRLTAMKSANQRLNTENEQTKLSPQNNLAYKKSLKRVSSLKSSDFTDWRDSQKNALKQNELKFKNPNNSKKSKDIEHQKLNDKLHLIQQKVLEMKNDLIKKKQQKQRIIKQQVEQRQRWHKQRQLRAQIDHQQKQKKRKPNNIVEEKIKKISKIPIKLKIQEQQQNNISIPSILQEKQVSIIEDLVTQLPEPSNIHRLTQNPYSPRNNIYYVSEIVKTYKDDKSLAKEHLIQSLQIMRNLQSSRMPSQTEVERRKLNLPQKKQYLNKKVLIFDLDETLIHCNSSLSKSHDVKIAIKFQNGTIVQAGINIRPYARQILRNLHKDFQIIVFTASQSCYADQVLNILDPKRQYIAHRLYREHCYLSHEGNFIKDLRIINRQLSDIILVDNAAYSYFFQLQNGIPIIPYYQGSIDFQLRELQKYLKRLILERDIRKINRQTFKLHRYHQYYNTPNKLVEDLYINHL